MKAWSYSRIKAFETCPLQFYHTKVIKTYEQKETDAMRYGTAFHLAAEEYIRDDTPLPKAFLFAKKALDVLAGYAGEQMCELEMGVREDLTACGFDDEDTWYRGICDLAIINGDRAKALDYKTGSLKSLRYADMGQLELMALAIFAKFPEVETVQSALIYVVADKVIKDSYTRKDIPKLWEKWLTKHAAMDAAFKNDVWNTKPSGLCRAHCPVLECIQNGRN